MTPPHRDAAGFALKWTVAALLVAGIALPASARLVAHGLLAAAGIAFLRRGSSVREIPPALCATLAALLAAVAHAHFAGDAPTFDRGALLCVVALLPALAPFYLADHLPPVDRLLAALLALAFARHFQVAAAAAAAGVPILPLDPSAPFLSGHPALPLLLLFAAPLLDRVAAPVARAALDLAWFFLALACASPFQPGTAAALLCGLALAAVSTRRRTASLRLALYAAGLLATVAWLTPGGSLPERLHGALAPHRARVVRALEALSPTAPEAGAEAGPGFAALRRRLSAALPGGRLDEEEFARLPAALLFPLGPGIPFALLYLAFHLALLRRLAHALKKVPRDGDARPFIAGALGATAGLTVLLFFTAVPSLAGAAAPFLFLAGAAATLVARSTEPLPRKSAIPRDSACPGPDRHL